MLERLLAEATRRWGFDPAQGIQIAVWETILATPIEPSRPLLVVPLALLADGGAGGASERSPLPGRSGPSGQEPGGLLERLYGPRHHVGLFDLPDGAILSELAPALAQPLYVPPRSAEAAVASPWSLPWIAARLREPDGCPWDREQTHRTLKKHLLEEAYEVYEALEEGSTPALAGELGDLYLQIVLHAQLAAEAGVFDLTDVQASIGEKIVRRHPHVFGDAVVRTASDVNRQWEQIKKAEREAAAGEAAARRADAGRAAPGGDPATDPDGGPGRLDVRREAASALDGISRAMPALAASQEMQERAASLGYDWPAIDGIVEKLHEELGELLAATSDDNRREEVGDLLLVAVNLARRQGVEAEDALRMANEKFRRRFRIVERLAAARGVSLRDLDFSQLDELWDAAKAEEGAR